MNEDVFLKSLNRALTTVERVAASAVPQVGTLLPAGGSATRVVVLRPRACLDSGIVRHLDAIGGAGRGGR